MIINGGNLAPDTDDEPLVDQNDDDIEIVVQAYSKSLKKNIAYKFSHHELRSCQLGRLDFNMIINFMIDRLRDSHGEEA